MGMKPENKAKLVDILKYHVLPEEVLSTQLKPFQAVTTVEGKPLHVQEWGGKVHVVQAWSLRTSRMSSRPTTKQPTAWFTSSMAFSYHLSLQQLWRPSWCDK